MPPVERPLSVTYYAYFPATRQFQARACGMELSEDGVTTQVCQNAKNGPWALYVYYRCVVHSDEFDAMARRVEATAKVWGGWFDGWEYPMAGDPEIDLPGDWEDVELYPIETMVAKSGDIYRVKVEPL